MIEFAIRVGEMTLKGENKPLFEKRLAKNIRRLLRGATCDIRSRSGRFYLQVDDAHERIAAAALSRTFGIVGFSRTHEVEKEMAAITQAALEVMSRTDATDVQRSFKVRSKRSDKSFPKTSHEIESIVGDALRDRFPLLEVNLSSPDILLQIEVREKAYVFIHDSSGHSGLPVGCAGRGILLLSGGIDSPVAGYFMAKRGLKLDALYFHSHPYTSADALEKVEDIARLLSPFNIGITLFVVNFTPLSLHIRDKTRPSFATLLMRGCMMEIATQLAVKRQALAIVTGEALSQVASQTIESIRFVDSCSGFPVLRPLVGFDKLETIDWAKKLGTYDISIRPFDDCCTVFTPDTPIIRPKLESVEREYSYMKADVLISEAVETVTAKWFEPEL